jgi:hypothetical protein
MRRAQEVCDGVHDACPSTSRLRTGHRATTVICAPRPTRVGRARARAALQSSARRSISATGWGRATQDGRLLEPLPDGSHCNDNNACTQTDRCETGRLHGNESRRVFRPGIVPRDLQSGQRPVQHGPQAERYALHRRQRVHPDRHVLERCVRRRESRAVHRRRRLSSQGPATPRMACGSQPVKSNGASCDDGIFCTLGDSCTAGVCHGVPAMGCCQTDPECEDGVACTEDRRASSTLPTCRSTIAADRPRMQRRGVAGEDPECRPDALRTASGGSNRLLRRGRGPVYHRRVPQRHRCVHEQDGSGTGATSS